MAEMATTSAFDGEKPDPPHSLKDNPLGFGAADPISYEPFRKHRATWAASFRRGLEYRIFCFGVWLGQTLSVSRLQQLGRITGRLAYHLFPKDRGIAETQLARVFPEVSSTERQQWCRECFQSFGQFLFEFLGMSQIAKNPEHWLGVENPQVLENALKQEKGVIVLTMHLGNWELFSVLAEHLNQPMVAAVANVPEPRINQKMREMRERGPMQVVPRGDDEALGRILNCFRNREVFVLATDQDTNVPSIWAPFFNLPAKTPIGATAFALMSGAPVVSGLFVRGKGGRFRLHLADLGVQKKQPQESDEQATFRVTRNLNRQMEALVRQHPQQWAWFHRRWRHKPTEAELARMQALEEETCRS